MPLLASFRSSCFRRAPLFFFALALTSLVIAGCGGSKGSQSAAAGAGPGGPGAQAPSVTVAVAAQQPIPIEVDAVGNAQPFRSVNLKSMVDGQIVRVLFHQGDSVHTGQLLFQLDKRPFQAALDQAQGKLTQDKATAAFNQAQANRYRALGQSGVVAAQEVQQQEAMAQASTAAVQADNAAVETARVSLGYTDIRAPIDAKAGAILVNVGNLVKANDTNPLTVLNQISPIYVQFSVPEAELAAVSAKGGLGLPVQALAPQDSNSATGKLTFINNAVDATTGTISLMATFDNRDRRLWPGEFLNVRLRLGTNPNAVVVPATAILTGQQGKYVYVVQPDGTAAMRAVTSSRTYRQLAVIDSGVQAGDHVIVDGQIKVTPNSKVTVAKTVPVQLGPEQTAQNIAGGTQ